MVGSITRRDCCPYLHALICPYLHASFWKGIWFLEESNPFPKRGMQIKFLEEPKPFQKRGMDLDLDIGSPPFAFESGWSGFSRLNPSDVEASYSSCVLFFIYLEASLTLLMTWRMSFLLYLGQYSYEDCIESHTTLGSKLWMSWQWWGLSKLPS